MRSQLVGYICVCRETRHEIRKKNLHTNSIHIFANKILYSCFIRILSRFYLDFIWILFGLYLDFICILYGFHLDFILIQPRWNPKKNKNEISNMDRMESRNYFFAAYCATQKGKRWKMSLLESDDRQPLKRCLPFGFKFNFYVRYTHYFFLFQFQKVN